MPVDMQDLIRALRCYSQADEEGIMVLVSRQACDEGARELERLTSHAGHAPSGYTKLINPPPCMRGCSQLWRDQNGDLWCCNRHGEAATSEPATASQTRQGTTDGH